jgi:hypothetical protein
MFAKLPVGLTTFYARLICGRAVAYLYPPSSLFEQRVDEYVEELNPRKTIAFAGRQPGDYSHWLQRKRANLRAVAQSP